MIVGIALLYHPYIGSRLATFTATPLPVPPTVVTTPTSPGVATTITRPAMFSSAVLIPSLVPMPTATQTVPHAIPARIVIPAIGVDAPVVPVSAKTTRVGGQEYSIWEVPDTYAAGWHNTSAPPGMPGNTVLNGHNTTHGEVFRDLYRLQTGDSIVVYAGDVPYTYTVSSVLTLPEAGQPIEVRLENARYILPTRDERLTLVTCHPYGSLRYRLIVIAFPDKQQKCEESEGHKIPTCPLE